MAMLIIVCCYKFVLGKVLKSAIFLLLNYTAYLNRITLLSTKISGQKKITQLTVVPLVQVYSIM